MYIECKIEALLRDNGGHTVLWTPPYCPKPIELFLGQGKNYAANHYGEQHPDKKGEAFSMRACVSWLREGWYGDGGDKAACNCAGLVKKAEAEATILIGKLDGLSGTINDLVIAEDAVFATAAEAGSIDHLINAAALLPVAEDGLGALPVPGEDAEEAAADDDEDAA